MEAIYFSETSDGFQRSTRRDTAEDRTLHNYRCENLKYRMADAWLRTNWLISTERCEQKHAQVCTRAEPRLSVLRHSRFYTREKEAIILDFLVEDVIMRFFHGKLRQCISTVKSHVAYGWLRRMSQLKSTESLDMRSQYMTYLTKSVNVLELLPD
jgi:hypothetical protein